MKVKLAKLINAAGTQQQPGPLARLCAQECPARLAFTLSKVMKAVGAEFQTYEEQRNALVKKHGTEMDGGHSVKPGDAGWEAFLAEYNDLVSVETEVAVEPLPVEMLEGVRVSATELAELDWLIVEG